MSWLSGTTAGPSGVTRPERVIVGLAHRGDDLVVALIIEKPEFLTPITVALTPEQACLLHAQLGTTLAERNARASDGDDATGTAEAPNVAVDGRTADAGGDGPHDRSDGR